MRRSKSAWRTSKQFSFHFEFSGNSQEGEEQIDDRRGEEDTSAFDDEEESKSAEKMKH
jgi:hypothetical protein